MRGETLSAPQGGPTRNRPAPGREVSRRSPVRVRALQCGVVQRQEGIMEGGGTGEVPRVFRFDVGRIVSTWDESLPSVLASILEEKDVRANVQALRCWIVFLGACLIAVFLLLCRIVGENLCLSTYNGRRFLLGALPARWDRGMSWVEHLQFACIAQNASSSLRGVPNGYRFFFLQQQMMNGGPAPPLKRKNMCRL